MGRQKHRPSQNCVLHNNKKTHSYQVIRRRVSKNHARGWGRQESVGHSIIVFLFVNEQYMKVFENLVIYLSVTYCTVIMVSTRSDSRFIMRQGLVSFCWRIEGLLRSQTPGRWKESWKWEVSISSKMMFQDVSQISKAMKFKASFRIARALCCFVFIANLKHRKEENNGTYVKKCLRWGFISEERSWEQQSEGHPESIRAKPFQNSAYECALKVWQGSRDSSFCYNPPFFISHWSVLLKLYTWIKCVSILKRYNNTL